MNDKQSNFPLTISDRKIRIALAGCGRISAKHFEAFEKHNDDLELIAICDTAPDLLKKFKVNSKIDKYKKLDDLLENKDIDLVSICTPSGIHSEQVVACARAGKHVVTEKPMATRWKDGVKMVKACDDAAVRLFVVKQNRHNSTLNLLKKAIVENRFGHIYMVNINVFWTRPQEYYDGASWRGTWEFDGGALMNQASHYVDLLDWLIGPVASIHAMTGTLARNIEVEDTAVLNVKWRSGALGSMNVTMLTYPKNLEGSITIIGEKGTAKVGGIAVNKIEHWEFEDENSDDKFVKNANYETSSVYGFGHTKYYENVISTLRGITEPNTDGREGLRSLEILIAAYLSARDGKLISFPLEY